MSIYIYIYIYTEALRVMVIVIGKGNSHPNLNFQSCYSSFFSWFGLLEKAETLLLHLRLRINSRSDKFVYNCEGKQSSRKKSLISK